MAKKLPVPPAPLDVDDSKIPVYRMPGRPPKKPKNLLRFTIRCLVSHGVYEALAKAEQQSGLTRSNFLRKALYNQLRADGLLTPELEKDATWDELRALGQI